MVLVSVLAVFPLSGERMEERADHFCICIDASAGIDSKKVLLDFLAPSLTQLTHPILHLNRNELNDLSDEIPRTTTIRTISGIERRRGTGSSRSRRGRGVRCLLVRRVDLGLRYVDMYLACCE